MHFEGKQFARALTAAVSVFALALPTGLAAQTAAGHLVTPSQLQQSAVNASHARQQNVETLRDFFSTPQAQKALESADMNPQEVNKAVAALNDHELAQLSARARKAQLDFAAGDFSNHDLLILLVAIAALILIIVAVR